MVPGTKKEPFGVHPTKDPLKFLSAVCWLYLNQHVAHPMPFSEECQFFSKTRSHLPDICLLPSPFPSQGPFRNTKAQPRAESGSCEGC